MKVDKFNLGEVYEFYIDTNDTIANKDVKRGSINGTIVGLEITPYSSTNLQILLIGWKVGEPRPSAIKTLSSTYDWRLEMISNITDYIATYSMHASLDVVKKITITRTSIGGFYCTKCNMPNPWADPNQLDGSYICYECTNRWW